MDPAILEKIKENDHLAIAECLSYINRWAQSVGISPSDADELSLKTIEQAFLKAHTFRGESTVGTWLIGIAKKTWAYTYRQNAKYTERLTSLDATPIDQVEDGKSIERMALNEILAEEIIRECLNEEERRIYIWREVDELSYMDIANLVGKSENAVRLTKYRADKKIREYVDNFWGNNDTVK